MENETVKSIKKNIIESETTETQWKMKHQKLFLNSLSNFTLITSKKALKS